MLTETLAPVKTRFKVPCSLYCKLIYHICVCMYELEHAHSVYTRTLSIQRSLQVELSVGPRRSFCKHRSPAALLLFMILLPSSVGATIRKADDFVFEIKTFVWLLYM